MRLPEPCACYAEGYVQGKEKAHFEIRAVLDSNHNASCGSDSCRTIRDESKLQWEMNGNERSFITRFDGLAVSITKSTFMSHSTFAVHNSDGVVVDSYTAHDFMGTMSHTLTDLFRKAK